MIDSLTMSGSSSVFHSSPFDDFKGTRPTHTDATSMTRRSGSVERSFLSFSRDGELRIDFSSRLEQCVVELRTEEERRGAQTIEFWTNRLEQARALRCDQRAKRANHIQAAGLGRAPGWKVVEDDPVGLLVRWRAPVPPARRHPGAGAAKTLAAGRWAPVFAARSAEPIEGAISRATAGGIRTDSKMAGRRSSR